MTIAISSDGRAIDWRWLCEHNLRGLHCGSGRNLQSGWLNTDCCQLVDAEGRPTEPGRIARLVHGGQSPPANVRRKPAGDFTSVARKDQGPDGPRSPEALYFLQHDATKPFPIEDCAFDWVYSEHFIEHISLEAALAWLKEVRRLLRPGGFARVSTPDLAKYMAGYVDPQGAFFAEHKDRLAAMGVQRVPTRRAWMVNQIFRHWGHQWLYDFEELKHVARAAGFSEITRCTFRQGREPEVSRLDRPVRNDESLYVELTKQ